MNSPPIVPPASAAFVSAPSLPNNSLGLTIVASEMGNPSGRDAGRKRRAEDLFYSLMRMSMYRWILLAFAVMMALPWSIINKPPALSYPKLAPIAKATTDHIPFAENVLRDILEIDKILRPGLAAKDLEFIHERMRPGLTSKLLTDAIYYLKLISDRGVHPDIEISNTLWPVADGIHRARDFLRLMKHNQEEQRPERVTEQLLRNIVKDELQIITLSKLQNLASRLQSTETYCTEFIAQRGTFTDIDSFLHLKWTDPKPFTRGWLFQGTAKQIMQDLERREVAKALEGAKVLARRVAKLKTAVVTAKSSVNKYVRAIRDGDLSVGYFDGNPLGKLNDVEQGVDFEDFYEVMPKRLQDLRVATYQSQKTVIFPHLFWSPDSQS